MQLIGKVLASKTDMIATKKGGQLAKTRMKVLDTGDEAAGEAQIYWIDFWGDAALSDDERDSIHHEEVTIEIRRVSASAGKDGRAYLNMTGGLVLLGGMPVQAKLGANTVKKSA